MISGSVKLPNGGRDYIDVLRNTQAQALPWSLLYYDSNFNSMFTLIFNMSPHHLPRMFLVFQRLFSSFNICWFCRKLSLSQCTSYKIALEIVFFASYIFPCAFRASATYLWTPGKVRCASFNSSSLITSSYLPISYIDWLKPLRARVYSSPGYSYCKDLSIKDVVNLYNQGLVNLYSIFPFAACQCACARCCFVYTTLSRSKM